MFWFISPWEAARISLEAQRRVMALSWLYFASGRRQEGLFEEETGPSGSGAPPVPAKSMANARPRAIPARKATETIKERISARRRNTRGLEERTRSVRK
jgi:hypothetical protein